MSFPNPGYQQPQQQGFGGQQGQQPGFGGQPQAPQPALATQSVDDFFAAHGGGTGAPSFHFGAPGATVQGTIVDIQIQQKTKPVDGSPRFDKNGKPLMQAVVTLQTELRGWQGINPERLPTGENDQPLPSEADDGKRRIYLWYTLRDAVTKAMAAAGVPAGKPLRIGDLLAVRVTGAEKNPHGGDPIKQYEANFRAGNPAADQFFGQQAAQAPAQQPQQQGFQQAAQQQGYQPGPQQLAGQPNPMAAPPGQFQSAQQPAAPGQYPTDPPF